MRYELKTIVKPSDVYNIRYLQRIQDSISGYMIVDFRPPQDKDTWLASDLVVTTGVYIAPRFILKRIQTVTDVWE